MNQSSNKVCQQVLDGEGQGDPADAGGAYQRTDAHSEQRERPEKADDRQQVADEAAENVCGADFAVAAVHPPAHSPVNEPRHSEGTAEDDGSCHPVFGADVVERHHCAAP